MIPYYTFMVFATWFILAISGAGAEPKEGMEYAKIVILNILTLILWSYQVLQEVIQFNNDDNSVWEYISSLQNLGDIICLTLTPTLCFANF